MQKLYLQKYTGTQSTTNLHNRLDPDPQGTFAWIRILKNSKLNPDPE